MKTSHFSKGDYVTVHPNTSYWWPAIVERVGVKYIYVRAIDTDGISPSETKVKIRDVVLDRALQPGQHRCPNCGDGCCQYDTDPNDCAMCRSCKKDTKK